MAHNPEKFIDKLDELRAFMVKTTGARINELLKKCVPPTPTLKHEQVYYPFAQDFRLDYYESNIGVNKTAAGFVCYQDKQGFRPGTLCLLLKDDTEINLQDIDSILTLHDLAYAYKMVIDEYFTQKENGKSE